jgi:hypothetical protein
MYFFLFFSVVSLSLSFWVAARGGSVSAQLYDKSPAEELASVGAMCLSYLWREVWMESMGTREYVRGIKAVKAAK